MKSNVKSERLDNANCQLHGGNQIVAEKYNVRFDIQNFMWQEGEVGGRGSEGGASYGGRDVDYRESLGNLCS